MVLTVLLTWNAKSVANCLHGRSTEDDSGGNTLHGNLVHPGSQASLYLAMAQTRPARAARGEDSHPKDDNRLADRGTGSTWEYKDAWFPSAL